MHEEGRAFLIRTNYVWLVPAFLALLSGSLLWSLMALTMLWLSLAYHNTEARSWELTDTFFAFAYVLCGPLLLWQSGVSVVGWLCAFFVAIVVFLVYVTARTKRLKRLYWPYVWWHGSWHVAAALMTTFVYLLHFGYVKM